jgi:hypothetical protein
MVLFLAFRLVYFLELNLSIWNLFAFFVHFQCATVMVNCAVSLILSRTLSCIMSKQFSIFFSPKHTKLYGLQSASELYRLSAHVCGYRAVTGSAQQIPTAVNLGFLDQSRYYFVQVASQLSS